MRWSLLLPTVMLVIAAMLVYRGYVVLAAERSQRFVLSRRHAATFARETLARTLIAATWPLEVLPAPKIPRGIGLGTPVILIPDARTGRVALTWLSAFLRNRGFTVHTMPTPRPLGSLAQHAGSLAECVEQISASTGASQVDLVGFSRGGLVAAWYIRHLQGAQSVRRMVTLGTPWRGTRTAIFRRDESAREVRWDNPSLDDLVPPSVPTVCIWSPDDPEIVPTESAIPEHGVESVRIDGAGHFELLFSPRAYRAVQTALSSVTREPIE